MSNYNTPSPDPPSPSPPAGAAHPADTCRPPPPTHPPTTETSSSSRPSQSTPPWSQTTRACLCPACLPLPDLWSGAGPSTWKSCDATPSRACVSTSSWSSLPLQPSSWGRLSHSEGLAVRPGQLPTADRHDRTRDQSTCHNNSNSSSRSAGRHLHFPSSSLAACLPAYLRAVGVERCEQVALVGLRAHQPTRVC